MFELLVGANMSELYDVMDKSEWLDGPWKAEPDRIYWIDEETKYPCIIRRSPGSGALCGYVGIPANHPYYGASYDAVSEHAEVHGGLTYASECDGDAEKGICHLSDTKDEVFWYGFDCAHFDDFMPLMECTMRKIDIPSKSSEFSIYGKHDEYKDMDYVKNEVTSLAKQLFEIRDIVAEGFETAEEHDRGLEEFIEKLPETVEKLKAVVKD